MIHRCIKCKQLVKSVGYVLTNVGDSHVRKELHACLNEKCPAYGLVAYLTKQE